MKLGEKVHGAMVEQFAKPGLVGHISRDTTAIEGREKPVAKVRPPKPAPRKKGRPRRGEVLEPKPETRLQRQARASRPGGPGQSCRRTVMWERRRTPKAIRETWRGYKLHADVSDCCWPISVAPTAASLHDSQVAIPLMKMTSGRVDYLYDLMESRLMLPQPIYELSRSLGHVPIIDRNSSGERCCSPGPS